MQLNGKLLENINISGVLTDQSFPLQAEGSTQELKDFDKVFFKVQHQNFELEAGDIEYLFSDNMQTINRKLEGLKVNFNINNGLVPLFMQTLKGNSILLK